MSEEQKRQVLYLENRNLMRLNFVKSIVSFDEGELVIDSEDGRVHVEGRELRIDDLSKDRGEISVFGKIDGVYFVSEGPREERPFFRWRK